MSILTKLKNPAVRNSPISIPALFVIIENRSYFPCLIEFTNKLFGILAASQPSIQKKAPIQRLGAFGNLIEQL